MMIKRIGPSQPCDVGGRFENNPKMGCFFGHMPYLPNGAAQWATIHGMGDPTHRRSYGGILVSKLQTSWGRPFGNSSARSVNVDAARDYWNCAALTAIQNIQAGPSLPLMSRLNA